MKVVTKYIADDGTQFDSEINCLRHEEKFNRVVEWVSGFRSREYNLLSTLEDAFGYELGNIIRQNQFFNFYSSFNFTKHLFHYLEYITHDTKIRVRHWNDELFHVEDINLTGKVYLSTHENWLNGGYGDWMRLEELLVCYFETWAAELTENLPSIWDELSNG